MIQQFQKNTEQLPSIYIVFGYDASRDIEAAKQLKMLLPKANLIEIKITHEKVGHNVLGPLVQSKKYSQLLTNTIFSK